MEAGELVKFLKVSQWQPFHAKEWIDEGDFIIFHGEHGDKMAHAADAYADHGGETDRRSKCGPKCKGGAQTSLP